MRGHEDGVIVFGRTLQEAELTLFKMIEIYLKAAK
jgi:hypothetical protein